MDYTPGIWGSLLGSWNTMGGEYLPYPARGTGLLCLRPQQLGGAGGNVRELARPAAGKPTASGKALRRGIGSSEGVGWSAGSFQPSLNFDVFRL